MYHALYFPTFIFKLYVPYFPFFNLSQSKASVVNQMSHFGSLKIFFSLFNFYENGHIHNIVSTLTIVVKLDVDNNSIVSTLSDVVNLNVEIGNVDSTLFNVVNFNVDIHNVVTTLIWNCPTLRRHITLTTTLRQCWNVFWVMKNVAKRLHNFVKLIKLQTYIFSRIPLNWKVLIE